MSALPELSGERVLITGASGFIGSHLRHALSKTGGDVHAVSRNPPTGDRAVRWWQADLADFATTQRVLTAVKPDVIFHLAGHPWGAPGLEHVLPTLHNDLSSAVNVLTVATELKTRRVLLTASLEEPQSHDPELVPASPYAAAKWACGAYARMFHKLYQTPVVVVRIFMAYGPGQPERKIIPYVILSLLKQQVPQLSSGQRLVDWIYIDDVIDGLVAAAQAKGIEGRTVELGSGTLVPIREVVEHLIHLGGAPASPSYGAVPPRPVEPVRAANIQDAYARLGWKPTTPLAEGLARTMTWYASQLKQQEPPPVRNIAHKSGESPKRPPHAASD